MSRKSPVSQNKLDLGQVSILSEFPPLIDGLNKLFLKATNLIEETMPLLVEIIAQVDSEHIEPLDRFIKSFKLIQHDFSGYKYNIDKFQKFIEDLKNIESGKGDSLPLDMSLSQKPSQIDIAIEMLMINQLKFKHIEENMSKLDDKITAQNTAFIDKLGTIQSILDNQIKAPLGKIESMSTKTDIQTTIDQFENRQYNALKIVLKDLFLQQANQFYQDIMTKISIDLTKTLEVQLSTIGKKLFEAQTISKRESGKTFDTGTTEIPSAQMYNEQITLSADLTEIKRILKFFSERPTDKQQCITQVEETRDILLTRRTTEAPYRVTASTIFREALGILGREDKVVQPTTNRKIIELLEKLFEYVASGS